MIKLPEHAPYTDLERESLESLLSGLTGEQRQWLGAFLAGVSMAEGAAAPVAARSLTILYGSESGNCEALADVTARAARKSGLREPSSG